MLEIDQGSHMQLKLLEFNKTTNKSKQQMDQLLKQSHLRVKQILKSIKCIVL